MFENRDISLIKSYGLEESAVSMQLEHFQKGFPFLRIVAPAIVGHGIICLDAERVVSLSEAYDGECASRRVVKFVPASGAATRMFKELFEYVASGVPNKVSAEVATKLRSFAFYDSLAKIITPEMDDRLVIENIINSKGLGYGDKPKGLLLFHRYENEVRTAIEEHLVEGAQYASCGGAVNIHFTVSPEHMAGFKALVVEVLSRYESRLSVNYNISYSIQKNSTDTIAVNIDNTPFRNPDGSLLFRPAGHGALLSNMNDIDADIIFIKNIDNVTTDARRGDTVMFKKALGGMLIEVQSTIYALLTKLDIGVTEDVVVQAESFIRHTLNVNLSKDYDSIDNTSKVNVLRGLLNRPVRVCGMVRNEGEPGGGPFYAVNADDTISLQIVESSQISPTQADLILSATHFNPVDLVCGIKDYRGKKFDLLRYVDADTGFISEKSKDGKKLKALELPGLWNGSMANWNTIFVEVPITTFSPVKVVSDLLRAEHQN